MDIAVHRHVAWYTRLRMVGDRKPYGITGVAERE